MNNSLIKTVKKLISIVIFSLCCLCTEAQKGYIYVHVQAVNEDAAPSTGFPFSLNGGSTVVPNFTLNDRPDVVNTTSTDLGGGHGTGDGELWSITNNILYHRLSDSSRWLSTQTITGTAIARVDGATANQAVYINAGKAYFFNGTAGTTALIYDPAIHGAVNAADITYGNGYIVITRSDGSIWKNNGTVVPYTDSWTAIFAAATGAGKIDISTVTNNIVFTVGTTSVDTATLSGTITTVITASTPADVAFSDDGGLFTIIGGYVNKRTGAAWVSESTCPSNCKTITGGPASLVWTIAYLTSNNTIFTRSLDGSSATHWIDDERVRLTFNDNSIIIPVSPGIYTLTETKPTSWDILGEIIYDPSNNSTTSPSTNSASINVSAGEVVHVIMQNERLVPVPLQKQCSANQVVEDFGAAPSTAAYVAPAPLGITGYHYFANQRFDDGSYSVANNSVNWPNASLIDHTTGTSNGCYMLVNASFQQDEFYRKRVTNLVPGISYKLSFWAASLSGGNNSIITAGISDSNTVVLGSYVTPGFNGSTYYTWKNYTFTFTATTSLGDIFLRNSGVGGGGNDLALDDITLTPLATTFQTLTYPATLCAGTSSTLTASPAGGIWTSGNTAVATVSATAGVLLAKNAGAVSINYNLTNAIGCITDSAVLISVNQSPAVTAAANPGTVCRNQVITLSSTATGGLTPYTGYQWTTGSGGNITGTTNTQNTTASQAAAGSYTYTVTVTDGNGCIGKDSAIVAITSAQSPVVTVGQNSTSLCGTGQTVSLTSSLSPAAGTYSFVWTGSLPAAGLNSPVNQSTATATPTTSGSYSYTLNVTDANGCVGSGTSAVIKASPGLSVTVGSSNPKLCSGQSLTVSSTPSGGILPYAYAWSGSPSGANITSATNIQNITAKPTVAGSYNYAVTVTDANSCTASGSVTATVTLSASTAPAVTATASSTSACNGQTTITLTANRTNTTVAGYNYVWSGSALTTSAYSSTATPTTTTAAPTVSGTYSVSITDGNGCSGYGTTAAVTVNPLPVVAPAASYISSNLCTGQNITLTSNPSGGTGTVTAWTYTWSQSTGGGVSITNTQNTTASPITGGTYTYNVSATDTKGCTSSSSTAPVSVTVSASGAPTVTATVSAASACSGQTTLTLTASRSTTTVGAYAYVWSGSGVTTSSYSNTGTPTTTTAVPVANGVYSVRVTDGNNCTGTASTSSVTVRPVPSISATSNSSACLGSTLSLLSVVNGGTSPYTYLWTASAPAAGLGASNTQNTQATPTATGTYLFTVKATDSYSCTATGTTGNISVVPAISVSAAASATAFCTGSNSINLSSSVSGGNSPYTYSWTGSSGSGLSATTNTQNTTANPTADGSSYAILVLDNNGCSASAFTSNITVSQSPSVNAVLTTPSQPICKGTSVSLAATPSSGSGNYTGFLWSGPGINSGNQNIQNPSVVTPSTSGSFTVQVTDNNGCTATGTTAALSVTIVPVMVTLQCYGNYAELSEYGGSAVSWFWTASNSSAVFRPNNIVQNPTTIYNGSYQVVATDGTGCKDSASILNVQGSCAILPVTYTQFSVEKKGSKALLKWQTASETNNGYFEVERMSDVQDWRTIGKVKGNPGSFSLKNYLFQDDAPPTGTLFYRLKQTDYGGKTFFSQTIAVSFSDVWKLSVYPNPLTLQTSLLHLKSNKALISAELSDATGKRFREKIIPGTNVSTIDITGFKAGIYFLRIVNVNKQENLEKIVIGD